MPMPLREEIAKSEVKWLRLGHKSWNLSICQMFVIVDHVYISVERLYKGHLQLRIKAAILLEKISEKNFFLIC